MARCTAVPMSAGLSATVMPAASKRGDLLRGCSLAAGNDGAGVAHAFSRRRCSSGDEGRDRLGDVRFDKLRGLLFRVAADFAHHQDGFRLIVFLESGQQINERCTHDRIAADANTRALAETKV